MIAAMPSTEVASNIDADGLNAMWDKLVTAFDAYYNSIEPKSNQGLINRAISQWQDFYYGNMGEWKADDIVRWRGNYTATAQLFVLSVKAGAKPEATPVATTQAKKSDVDAVFYVTGKTTPVPIKPVVIPKFVSPVDLSSPGWLVPIFLGIPVMAWISSKLTNKRK